MRRQKIFILLFLCLLFRNSIAQNKTPFPDSLFHPDSLRAIVEILASDSLEGRLTGSVGCLKAAAFIATEFQKAGLKPVAGMNGFFMPFSGNSGNIVGAIRGKTKPYELVIFSAHYDHIGTATTNPYPHFGGTGKVRSGDAIYNGANDNASGVSAVISLAKYFAKQNNIERTLLFVAFAGEEQGLLGSKYFSSMVEPDSIIAVINLEMIGRKYDKSGKPYMTGSLNSNLIDILNRRLFENNAEIYGKKYIMRDKFTNEKLFSRSDNYPFALLGIPAHTIMATSPTDDYYHSLGDEVSTLDFKLMNEIIKAIAISCQGLVDGTDTPKRLKNPKWML